MTLFDQLNIQVNEHLPEGAMLILGEHETIAIRDGLMVRFKITKWVIGEQPEIEVLEVKPFVGRTKA